MRPVVPTDLIARAAEWDELHRWERSELGKALRRLGLTYGEIRELIPVPKGTLSYWCREIRLTDEQITAIKDRTGPHTRVGIPVDTQWRRRQEIDAIRARARAFAEHHLDDAFFVAGVVLYWAEGAKTGGDLSLANADPRALRYFIAWVRRYLDPQADFVLKVNLHADNDEPAARRYWASESGLDHPDFHKTFVKPDGTGHRKNHLQYGVCQIRMRRCANAWHTTMAWIDVVADARGVLRTPSLGSSAGR